MKKKILFIGFMLSIMCMFSSCLVVFGDEDGWGSGSGSYTYDLQIVDDTVYSGSEIGRVYVRKRNTDDSFAGDWQVVYSDGYDYTGMPLYSDRASCRSGHTVYADVPSSYSGTYDIMAFLYIPDTVGDDDAEYRYAYEVYVSKKGNKKLYLSDLYRTTTLQ